MRIVFFVHSIVSDWNNGHAHFQRGWVRALTEAGHSVLCCEPHNNWSTENLFKTAGAEPILDFARTFPFIHVTLYDPDGPLLDTVDELTAGADMVIVHEFNEPAIVGAVAHVRRARGDFLLLFHDTHHKAVSVPHLISRLNLAPYDGVLAFGQSLADVYRTQFGVENVFVLHEAADTDLFRPMPRAVRRNDVVWIGNWGDDERSREIRQYLVESARRLPHLRFAVYGVRYPDRALEQLDDAGIDYRGWIPNYRVPEVFAESRLTLHIMRGYYNRALPGIPTIRPFEAMACGIPLLSTSWEDAEGLFTPGRDYLVADSPRRMRDLIDQLTRDPDRAAAVAEHGLDTIRRRHSCRHRAEELLAVFEKLTASAV